MNADNSLISLTLPESIENEIPIASSSLSNASSFLPSKRGFKMACLNINSLVKHVDELRVLLSEFSVGILSINETKLDESIKKVPSSIYQAASLSVVTEVEMVEE